MQPKIKGRIHYDEKVILMKGERKYYDLNAIDSRTKYVLAHLFVEKRTLSRCVKFLQQIKDTCYAQILEQYYRERKKPKKKRRLITFVCDGFENYKTAWSKLFSKVSTLVFGVPIACKKYGLKHNNNPVERYNGTLKDRIKILRGGFESFAGGEAFMNLKHVIHNFVNPHQGLTGKTPAEAADLNLPLGQNKLLSLIHYRAKRRQMTRR